MDSEKILLNMYKKHQYESTEYNIQGVIMLVSAAALSAGAVLTVFLTGNMFSFYLFLGAVFVTGISFLLQKFRAISRNTASIIYIMFVCFALIPANWVVSEGIRGVTPFIMVIVMVAIMIVFSDKTRKIIQYCYLAAILALIVYSVIIAISDDFFNTLYIAAAFSIVIVMVTYYLRYMLRKYDQMHDNFLSGSIKDELTRVLSRNVMDVVVNYVESFFRAKQMDYAMIMIDVDNFKKLNDEHGHVVGDIVLRNTAECIREHMREEDFVIRYGGDEFLVILLGASIVNAKKIFGRVEQEQQCQQLLDFNITVSRGYAVRSECETPQEVIELADKRMYEHKETKHSTD